MTVKIAHLEFDHVAYDSEGDVLYLSVGEPREPAYQEATADGHLVRYDADDQVIGVTIVNARWLMDRDGGVEITLRMGAEDLAPALA